MKLSQTLAKAGTAIHNFRNVSIATENTSVEAPTKTEIKKKQKSVIIISTVDPASHNFSSSMSS